MLIKQGILENNVSQSEFYLNSGIYPTNASANFNGWTMYSDSERGVVFRFQPHDQFNWQRISLDAFQLPTKPMTIGYLGVITITLENQMSGQPISTLINTITLSFNVDASIFNDSLELIEWINDRILDAFDNEQQATYGEAVPVPDAWVWYRLRPYWGPSGNLCIANRNTNINVRFTFRPTAYAPNVNATFWQNQYGWYKAFGLPTVNGLQNITQLLIEHQSTYSSPLIPTLLRNPTINVHCRRIQSDTSDKQFTRNMNDKSSDLVSVLSLTQNESNDARKLNAKHDLYVTAVPKQPVFMEVRNRTQFCCTMNLEFWYTYGQEQVPLYQVYNAAYNVGDNPADSISTLYTIGPFTITQNMGNLYWRAPNYTSAYPTDGIYRSSSGWQYIGNPNSDTYLSTLAQNSPKVWFSVDSCDCAPDYDKQGVVNLGKKK